MITTNKKRKKKTERRMGRKQRSRSQTRLAFQSLLYFARENKRRRVREREWRVPPGRSPLERHKHKLKKKRSLHLFLVINSSPLLGTDTLLLYLQLLIDGAQKLLYVASADTRIPCHPVILRLLSCVPGDHTF
jgi:hypothetical protein